MCVIISSCCSSSCLQATFAKSSGTLESCCGGHLSFTLYRFILYLLQTILGWSTFEHITDCNRGIPVRKVGIITSTGNGNAKPIAGHSSHRNCVILPCGAIALQIGSSKGIVIMCISMCVCMNAKEN